MIPDLPPDVTLPALAEPYRTALAQAAGYILRRYPDTLGIIASGTIVRGNPSASSDLDLYVIRTTPQRQRVQRWFHGIPAEIFVNPAHQIARYLANDHAEGRPITAHMLATGQVILDRDPVIEQLRADARDALATPFEPSDQDLLFKRYMVATKYEDARDVLESDPASARMMLGDAVHGMLHVRFWRAGAFVPRDKDLLAALLALDPACGVLAQQFYAAATLAEQLPLAEQIAARTINASGFFPWESPPEDV